MAALLIRLLCWSLLLLLLLFAVAFVVAVVAVVAVFVVAVVVVVVAVGCSTLNRSLEMAAHQEGWSRHSLLSN